MPDAVAELLAGFPTEIAKLAVQIRDGVILACPDAREGVHSGWKVISYRYDNGFCAIAPHKRWVNVQFYEGVSLPDPRKRLEGSGKNMRHVKIRRAEDLDEAVIALVVAAAQRARKSDRTAT